MKIPEYMTRCKTEEIKDIIYKAYRVSYSKQSTLPINYQFVDKLVELFTDYCKKIESKMAWSMKDE